MTILMIIILFLTSIYAAADTTNTSEQDAQKWAGNLEMNGYSLEKYKGFANDWQLITVRYRQDSGEFRFVYANPIAYKAFTENKHDYPDGSVFAKTAYLLKSDSDFTSSLVPSVVNRYQLMVKNKNLHKETDGWGYALFDPTGKTFSGNPRYVAQSCHACHQIVKSKGFIFSDEIQKSVQYITSKASRKKSSAQTPRFTTQSISQLPKQVRSLLLADVKNVSAVTGELTKYIFSGTLNEIQPFLAKESLNSKRPAVLVSLDGKMFSIVYKDSASKTSCDAPLGKAQPMIALVSVDKTIVEAHQPYADLGQVSNGVGTRSFCFVEQ